MNAPLARTMRAIEIRAPGGPEMLVATPWPTPHPAAGEVLIKVQAAGVNRPDVMQRRGLYPPPPDASAIPGLEVAGTVVARGDAVKHPALGDTVCALVSGGGYAEYCVAAALLCLPVPIGLDVPAAAALPETFFTVWNNVFLRGALAGGERLLVHGGSSGIGTTAIQLGKAFGATVYITAGTAEKCRRCLALGADAAINYRAADFVARIAALTDNRGVDVILDMVGGDYLPRNITCLADQGRLVQIALQRGRKGELSLLDVMRKRLTITGSTLRPRSVAEKAIIADALRSKVWPLLTAGTVRPVVFRDFPLEQAADAHRLMESSEHIGKIVLTV